ncbi:tetraspanin-9-like [Dreissena polymorpha]|uniref:Tetraspanin n=1 Tax=Dreissena polymorpha TaxID=45954 RepID=A0A9D3YHE3_DREPO|nr:tetraspanin-9-like [Dreissena polymorpha]XP_052253888.1 tetraspanin-9-like [Dreissena polymorpha]XP_052253889.1 tetraspanin-9-like [Dreissena polymorpha]KAH3700086.1 hypothetical protein DPMN_075054 [Dreissena polymorpha]
MGVCEGCGQLILVLINVLFSVIGLALLVVACLVKFGSDVFDKQLNDGYAEFKQLIKDTFQGQDSAIDELDLGALIGDAAIAFIVIGAFFFLLGIFGCIGAICKVKCLLVVYMSILLTIFAAELVFVIMLFAAKDKIDGWLKTPLKDQLTDKYTGTNGTDAFTLTINFVMREFECCGIDKPDDFNDTKKWNRPIKDMVVPYICCHLPNDTECVTHPTLNNSYTEGCYGAINNWLTDKSHILIGVGSGVAAVQLILIISSLVICCQRRKENDDEYEDYKEDAPISPYRESAEAAHHNRAYASSQQQMYMEPPRDPGYNRNYPEPYKGRTDYYTAPPEGYGRQQNDYR